MELYHKSCLSVSRIITEAYSSSFSRGMKLLSPSIRKAIYAIYGFVRTADEIVDTFHGYDKKTMLGEFKEETYLAIERGISVNPVLQSYQWAVNHYQIDLELTESFFRSMETDLDTSVHDLSTYGEYIYGSAEVVGLMCLSVFYADRKEKYEELKEPARKLGEAFQKVNFLRDIRQDFEERGRLYFPDLDLHSFDAEKKRQIEAEIFQDFQAARVGIRKLDKGIRLGVYVAYRYYSRLLAKISRKTTEELLSQRVRIDNFSKLVIMSKAIIRHNLGIL